MKTKFLVPALVLVVASAALFGGSLAHAQTSGDGTNQHSSIIQRLVDRFGLNANDVKTIFDEEHAAREAEQQARKKTRLDQLVTDGKITAAQEQLIIDKCAELEANKPAFDSSLTPEQRKTQMEAQRTELENWAKTNGIDIQYLMGGFGHRGFGGHGMMRGDVPMMDGAAVPTSSN